MIRQTAQVALEKTSVKRIYINNCICTPFCLLKSIFITFFSDAWRRRRRRRRNGLMDENEIQVSNNQGQDIPDDAKQKVVAAFNDLETFEDEEEEYDIHPKHVI